MAMESGSWRVRVWCRGCGRTATLWLNDVPLKFRQPGGITDHGIAAMRCQTCGLTHPRVEVYWAPGSFKRPSR